ncbi:hypothetical protein AXF42_Ash014706 [Apostasia shenzhenica]|uniref:Uncharacterized protein n=1 Tax=Apostasia shenzhenica TaxID=1088818 RepID=A0A2I0AKE7_9ASPA|nr:hypothetical protein AXF42_Ash014706 [Apostasia shenzhenica]
MLNLYRFLGAGRYSSLQDLQEGDVFEGAGTEGGNGGGQQGDLLRPGDGAKIRRIRRCDHGHQGGIGGGSAGCHVSGYPPAGSGPTSGVLLRRKPGCSPRATARELAASAGASGGPAAPQPSGSSGPQPRELRLDSGPVSDPAPEPMAGPVVSAVRQPAQLLKSGMPLSTPV